MSNFTKIVGLVSLVFFLTLFFILLPDRHKNQLSNQEVFSSQDVSIGREVFPDWQGFEDIGEPLVVEQLQENRFDKLPIAVVLDNLKESLPISGVDRASVVYEAPVEADITRFLAVFDQDFLPDEIGPVRSARPYLVDWAGEYGAIFVHAGGSSEALQKISQHFYSIIYDLDEISGDGGYFWRDEQRQGPHNLYISRQSIVSLINKKNLVNAISPDFEDWGFESLPTLSLSSGEKKEEESGVIVKIDYRQPVVWQFDKDNQVYLRFQDGQPFFDQSGRQIGVENLVIQKTEINILDEVGRRFIKTIGQGEALIFQNGFLKQGRWEKLEQNSRTKFYDLESEEIKFLPGTIWIEIVSKNHRVLY